MGPVRHLLTEYKLRRTLEELPNHPFPPLFIGDPLHRLAAVLVEVGCGRKRPVQPLGQNAPGLEDLGLQTGYRLRNFQCRETLC